ncbi:MAG: hypothetical protein M3Y77_03835, partial [Actinomycetota bacterium]|nr:hypothetical protein [Actinomycetota bacterium]
QSAVQPGLSHSGGIQSAWTMASPLTLVSAGLRLASTTSTHYASLSGFTAAEALRGNSFLADPVDPPDPIYQSPEDSEPVPPDLKAQLRPRLRDVCLMNSKHLGPDQIGDADMLCQGFADSALTDMGHLRRALCDFPEMGMPQLPQLTPWGALWEGVTDITKFTAQVAGYGACVDGDKSGCAVDLGFAMLGPVFGALKKAGETVGWVAKIVDKAGNAKKAVQDSKVVTAANEATRRLAEAKAAKQALTKRVNEFRDAVKPVKPGQETAPEAWLPVVAEKIPKDWPLPIRGKPSNDDAGKITIRFAKDRHGSNTVRIDRGNPNSTFPSQRVDHVVVTVNGQTIGPDGIPFPDGPVTEAERAAMHIPFSQWKAWSSWDHP